MGRMTRKRFCLLLGLPVALALAAFAAPEPAVEFIQLTDTHVTVHAGVTPDLAAARAHFAGSGKALGAFFANGARVFRPSFFLFTGDLIDAFELAGTRGETIHGQVEAFTRATAGSPAPLYLALGNHDIQTYGGITNGKLDADQSVAGEARAAWIAAAPCFRTGTYYSFEKTAGRTTYRFVMLDNGYPSIAAEQLEWLRKLTAQQGDRVMILAMHIPLGEDARSRSIKAAVAPARIALVLAGHQHNNNVAELPLEGGTTVQVRTAAFGYGADNWRRIRLLEDRIEVFATGAPEKLEKTISVRPAQ